jgi:hypothetical protein
MDPRVLPDMGDRDRLKLFAKQVALLMIFIVNIFTIVTSILLMNKYGLYYNRQSSGLSIVDSKSENEPGTVQINKDVDLESLIMADRLRIKSVQNDHILITAGDDQADTPQAGIFLTHDYITMQAASIGPSPDENFAMRLNREVDDMHAFGTCRNIRSIRSKNNVGGGSIKRTSEDDVIMIDSDHDELELSGNLGLQVHGRDVKVSSKEGITIESKEDIIELRSPGGLYLPNLPILDHELETTYSEARLEGQSQRPDEDRRRQLRIDKSDGLLYQARW